MVATFDSKSNALASVLVQIRPRVLKLMDYDIGQVVIYQGIIGWIIDKKEMLDFPLTTVSMQYKIEWADDSEIEWYSKETINEFIEELEDMEKKL